MSLICWICRYIFKHKIGWVCIRCFNYEMNKNPQDLMSALHRHFDSKKIHD